MACYLAAPLHVATWTGLDLHLDQTVARGPEHAALDAVLANFCQQRRDPLQAPFSPVPLMEALNTCLTLSNQYHFTLAHNGWDATSFLSCLLGELAVAPGFLVQTLEEGVCQQCGNVSSQEYLTLANHSYMLALVPPDQHQPVDLGQLLGATRQQPTAPSLACQHQGCPVAGARGMPSHLVPTPGQVLVQPISRLQQAPNWVPGQPVGGTVKRLTPVARPIPNHPEWPGMEAKVVLANSPGHWRPFVNVAVPGAGPGAGVWWSCDSQGVRQEDPWLGQCDPAVSRRGYTIDVVVFAQ